MKTKIIDFPMKRGRIKRVWYVIDNYGWDIPIKSEVIKELSA